MKKQICKLIRLYIRYFPIRIGKVPVLTILGKLGLFKGVELIGDLKGNAIAVLNLSDWVQQLVYFFGVYEFEKKETDAWLALTNENSTILDIGSNFGYYSLLSAGKFSSCKVHAFEPAPETFQRLVDNISLNSYKNIQVYNLGVSLNPGFFALYLANDDNSGMTSLSMPDSFSGREVEVEVVNMDDFIKEKDIKNIDLVKIDVEGNELNVLRSMQSIITTSNPIIFIELLNNQLNKFGHSITQTFDFFKINNYKCYEINKQGELKLIEQPKDIGLAICIHADKIQSVITIIEKN